MMVAGGMPCVCRTADNIKEFFTEFPDTRMGISYDNDVHLFIVRLSEEAIGSGNSVEDAIYSAKKNLAIKKVKTLASLNSDDEMLMALALKRAATFCSDKEMVDLIREIRSVPWNKK